MERWIGSAINDCFFSLPLHFNSTLIIIINECDTVSAFKKPSDAYTRQRLTSLS